MFDADHRSKLGLPAYGDSLSKKLEKLPDEWENYDAAAEMAVCEKLPFLADAPKLKKQSSLDPRRQKKWRLYRRAIPLQLAEKGDRSIAILGQIHTVQTPLVSEVQSLWAILYLLGEIQLPDKETMAMEISQWNSWTRRRYLNQGQKFPYSLYGFLPVSKVFFWTCCTIAMTEADNVKSTLTAFSRIWGSKADASPMALPKSSARTTLMTSMVSSTSI